MDIAYLKSMNKLPEIVDWDELQTIFCCSSLNCLANNWAENSYLSKEIIFHIVGDYCRDDR